MYTIALPPTSDEAVEVPKELLLSLCSLGLWIKNILDLPFPAGTEEVWDDAGSVILRAVELESEDGVSV